MKKPILIPYYKLICDKCGKEIIEDGYIVDGEKDYHPHCKPKE